MIRASFFRTFCLLFISTLLSAQIKTIPYQQLSGSSGIFFGASMSATTMTITFAGPSDRWIAIGFGVSMSPCDAFIYSNGRIGATHALGWNDYYCGNTSASNVNNDSSQDWTVVSTATASGQRTVVATRALNTSDVSDIVFSFSAANLNVVWARGAAADYTIAYHGSSNRANGISLLWLTQPVANFTTTSTNVCVGTALSYSNTSTGGQNTYTWNFAGASINTSSLTNPVVTYTAPGTYSVALTASNAIGSASIAQLTYITVNPTVVPSVSITQTGGTNPICSAALASYTATSTNGGPLPVYQWKVNGVNTGANSPTFSSTALPASAIITCVMTANSVCAVPNTATSSAINLTVNSSAPASVSIAITGGGNPTCSGSTLTFTATPGNGGSTPFYQWKINNVNTGTNSPTFTTATLNNGDVVSCEITSSSTCAVTGTAVSSGITMTVSSVLVPSVSVGFLQGSNPLCAGAALVFSATPFNGGSAPVYQWMVNGTNAGTNSTTFAPLLPANGNTISLVLTSNFTCASPNTATNSAIVLTINPVPPTPSLAPSGTVMLCSGNSLTLSSSAIGNSWSNGATAQSVVVTTAGVYSVMQTLNGCSSLKAGVTVSLIPSPVVSLLPVGSVCKDDAPVLLQGLPLGGTYSATAVVGGTFTPSASGPGTFVIGYEYTAPNTCKGTATMSINVMECTALSETESSGRILVFPNPITGSLLNLISESNNVTLIQVLDLNGKILLASECKPYGHLEIELNNLPDGIYILETRSHDKINRLKIINHR